jgi:outer membrane protein assembly factor BamA
VGVGLTVAPRALGYQDDGIVPFLSLQTGFGRPASFVQLTGSAEGRYTRAGLDSGSVHLAGTAYFQPGPRHLAVVHGSIGWMERPAPGAEFDLGGTRGGPRGFRQHFFTGDRAFFTSAEYRYTVTNDFLKLTAIGLAGWVDYGGAWYGGSPRRAMASVGTGLRFGWTRATDVRASRIDVACRNREDTGQFRCVLVIGQGYAFSTTGRLDR